MDKRELRRQMKARNRALSQAERAEASEQIFRQAEQLPAFAAARCVALFCALSDEPQTREALARWSRCKRLVVPRVEGERMRFFDYDPATLQPGAFGIDEPGSDAAECPPERIDLVFVPGVAFTAQGARLGRGRGYYDRYLSQPGMQAIKIGVCYAHQLVRTLPSEPHDVVMDGVIAR